MMSVDGQGEGRVMCTIRGVGNKALNHMNSLPALNNKVGPQSSVLTFSPTLKHSDNLLSRCQNTVW